MPQVVVFFRKDGVLLWARLCYFFFYLGVLPVFVAYTTSPYWKWKLPSKQKAGWLYLWSVAAMIQPTAFYFMLRLRFFTSCQMWQSILLLIQSPLQHLAPLMMIIMLDLNFIRHMAGEPQRFSLSWYF